MITDRRPKIYEARDILGAGGVLGYAGASEAQNDQTRGKDPTDSLTALPGGAMIGRALSSGMVKFGPVDDRRRWSHGRGGPEGR